MNETAALSRVDVRLPAHYDALPRQQSLLFPALFGQLAKRGHLSVLDVGPALPETVAFFSQLRCRLHFASLYTEPLVLEGSAGSDREFLVAEFTRLLAIPPGTLFDLCLFWDLPQYLDDQMLQAFDQALQPYLGMRSIGHGFAVRTQSARLDARWYGIDQPHLFTLREPWIPQPRFFPHSQAILINLMPSFNIDRGMLLPDGRLEVVMNSTLSS